MKEKFIERRFSLTTLAGNVLADTRTFTGTRLRFASDRNLSGAFIDVSCVIGVSARDVCRINEATVSYENLTTWLARIVQEREIHSVTDRCCPRDHMAIIGVLTVTGA